LIDFYVYIDDTRMDADAEINDGGTGGSVSDGGHTLPTATSGGLPAFRVHGKSTQRGLG